MALQDILNAIVEQADKQIADARAQHQKKLSQMREAMERAHAKKKHDIGVQRDKKKLQLKAKAESLAQTQLRNTTLLTKRALLDSLYDSVLKKLATLPEEKVEPLLRAYLKEIDGKGTIHPSEKHEKLLKKLAPSEQFTLGKHTNSVGGFLFTSDTREQDCTFEHLVQEWLRPQTELDISKRIFSQ